MKLSSLSVENFKAFERAQIRFSPGFNVIKGPNEAGKSSVQAAILMALFADATSTDSQMEGYTRWGQDERPRVTLAFEADGTTYELLKDFEQGTVSLSWSKDEGTADASTGDPSQVLHVVGGLLGSTSMDAYVNTACIRSEEVSKLPSATAPVSQRLQTKVMSGRRADATDVLKAIDHELGSLAASGLRRISDPSPLRASHERVEALQRQVRIAAEKLAEFQSNTKALVRLRRDLGAVEQDIAEWSRRLELSDRAQTLAEDIALLEEHAAEVKGVEQLRESVGQAATQLSSLDYETVARSFEQVQALERNLHRLRMREAEINHQLAVLALRQLQNVPLVSPTTLVAGGALTSVVFAALAIATHVAALFAGILVGVAVAASAVGLRRRVRVDDTGQFASELAACVQQIAEAEREISRQLSKYGLRSVEEIGTVLRALRPGTEARAIRQQRIEKLLGDQRVEDLQAALSQVAAQIAARRAELDQLATARLSGSAYEQVDRMVQSLTAKKESVQRELYRLEGELLANAVTSESLAAAEEELAAEQLRLARLERRRKGLERAQSGMREAVAATLEQVSGAFREGISKHLGQMTAGRYDQVDAQIDEAGLRLMVQTADHRRSVRADSLSRATQDQIYLAARMALLDLAGDGRRPPLLLDDPFVNYDEGRMGNTLELMRELYKDYQVILFTCVDRYDRYADSVFALAGPESDVEAPVEAGVTP